MPTPRTNKRPAVAPTFNWRTTDADEILRRRERATAEVFRISNVDARFPIFSNFMVKSPSGMDYSVEVRDVQRRQFSCECVDFRINGLGTCKHVEAVLLHLEARHKGAFRNAAKGESDRLDVLPDLHRARLRVAQGTDALPASVRHWFDAAGVLKSQAIDEALPALTQAAKS